MLRKATGPIRQQGVKMALEELATSSYDVVKLQVLKLSDSEEEEG